MQLCENQDFGESAQSSSLPWYTLDCGFRVPQLPAPSNRGSQWPSFQILLYNKQRVPKSRSLSGGLQSESPGPLWAWHSKGTQYVGYALVDGPMVAQPPLPVNSASTSLQLLSSMSSSGPSTFSDMVFVGGPKASDSTPTVQ